MSEYYSTGMYITIDVLNAENAPQVNVDIKAAGNGGGGTGEQGKNGGYYTPSIAQPNSETLTFSFRASEASMPHVPAKSITLPTAKLTDEDKAEIVQAVLEALRSES